ncbi:tape measure protein [Rothia mucilaginosa]|uniref:tape measure protein n=1 Tax=Rothia mucilaginosa TaxID=43675 RepID=UPI0034D690BC
MAGGYELAKAYVSVLASTKGAGAQIVSEIGEAGDRAGSQAGTKASSAFGRIFSSSVAPLVAKAIGGISIGSVFGTAFAKGFNRLKAIDVAQAKLRGLGNDADAVSVIMQNASASVKGTAFGLDAAATAAAGAVAAGIQPGEQLEAVLKSVSNSAAASGSSMEEMGGIYAKVASVGKAQNDVLAQVADRGIPIYQALGKQLGVTAEEVFKMASDGKINFEQFEKAMTAAAGNVAFEMGNTLPGAFANAQAALGRFGANILTGIYPALTKFFLAFQQWMKPVEAFGKVIGAQIGAGITKAGEAISAFAAGFKSTMGDGKSFTVTFEIIREEIARFASAFQTQGTGIVGVAQKVGAFLGTVLPPLLHSFVSVALNIIRVVGSLAVAFKSVLPNFSGAGDGANIATSAFDILESSIRLLSTGLFQLSQFIENHQQGVGRLVLALGTAVTAYKGVTTAIGLGKSTIESYNTAMGAISSAKDTVMGVAEGFKMLTSGAGSAREIAELGRNYQLGATAASVYEVAVRAAATAQTAFNTAAANIAGNLSKAFGLMKANPFTSLVGAIGIVAGALAYFFTQTETGRAAWESLMQAIQPALNTILPLIGQLGEKLIQSLQPALQLIIPALQRFAVMATQLFTEVVQAVQPVIDRLIPLIGQAIAALMASLGQIGQHLAPLLPMIVQFGTQIMQALAPVGEQLMNQLVPALAQLGAAVMAMLPQIMEIFRQLGEMLLQLVPVFGQIVAVVVDLGTQVLAALLPAIQSLLPVLAAIVGAVAGVVVVLVTSLIPVFASVVQAIVPLITTLIDILVPAIQAVLNVVTTVVQAIVPIVQGALNIVVGIIKTVTAIIKGDWSAAWEGIKQIVAGVWEVIKGIVVGAINIVSSIITNAVNLIRSIWDAAWNGIGRIVSTIWEGIKNGVAAGINTVVGFFRSMGSDIIGVVRGIPGQMISIGRDIVGGIASGIRNAAGAVMDAARSVVNALPDFVKSALGIHSPSRVMRDQVGVWIPAGIAAGIDKTSDMAVDAVRSMTDAAVEAAQDGMGSLSMALTPGAISGGFNIGGVAAGVGRASARAAVATPAVGRALHVHVNAGEEMAPERFGRRVGEAMSHQLSGLEGALL